MSHCVAKRVAFVNYKSNKIPAVPTGMVLVFEVLDVIDASNRD